MYGKLISLKASSSSLAAARKGTTLVGSGREFKASDYFFPRTQSREMADLEWQKPSFRVGVIHCLLSVRSAFLSLFS